MYSTPFVLGYLPGAWEHPVEKTVEFDNEYITLLMLFDYLPDKQISYLVQVLVHSKNEYNNSSHVVLAPLELHVLSRKSCLEKTKRDWFSNDRSSLHVETMVHFYEMIHFDVGPYVSIFKTWEWSQMKAGKKSILLLCNSTTPNFMVPKYRTKTSGVRSFVQNVPVSF